MDQAQMDLRSEAMPGHGWFPQFLPADPKVHWEVDWSQEAEEITIVWEYWSEEEGVSFSNGQPFMRVPVSYPTRFAPHGIEIVRGDSSMIVWGFDRRDKLVIERWVWSAAMIDGGVLVPGRVVSKQDLGVMGADAITDMRLLYDLGDVDPLTGYGALASVVFQLENSNDLYWIDLDCAEPRPLVLAGPSQAVQTQGGVTSPTFYVPELGQAHYALNAPSRNLHLGQLIPMGTGTASGDYIVVLDSDSDGRPDGVFPMQHDDAVMVSLIHEVDETNPAHDTDYAKYR